jgi:SAM-dependent methyltransferase
MTPEMLERARLNARRQGFTNVEFYESTIDKLPLPDASVDCIISNCVINLAPDKQAVLDEVARILKPGGRLAISDIALKKPLPPEIGNDLLAYVGCIAGAISIDEYINRLKAAGFSAVEVVDTQKDLNAYSQVVGQAACCAPTAHACSPGLTVIGGSRSPEAAGTELHARLGELLKKYDVNEYAASVQVFAVKP